MPVPFALVPGSRFTRSRPPRRVLVFFLGLSLAAHAVLIILAPHISFESMLAGSEPLEVTIQRPEPVPVQEPPAPPPATAAPKAMKKPKARRREPVAVPRMAEPASEIQVVPAQPQGVPEQHPSLPAPQGAAPPLLVTPPTHSAAYLKNPLPQYPLSSRMAGEEGTVILRVLVKRDGVPGRVEIRESSGWHNLDAAAREAVRKWRFVPGREGHEPVEAMMEVPITFRLKDAVGGNSRDR